jgi:hypothetical protein
MSTQNLRPFNLEEAKAGKPVQTREGRRATLFRFDLKANRYPLAGTIEDDDGEEVAQWRIDGSFYCDGTSRHDLFMAPVEKTVWVTLLKRNDGSVFPSVRCDASEQAGKEYGSGGGLNYVGTFPITYTE